MNDYESRRQERIKKNQALLASLDIQPLAPSRRDKASQSTIKRESHGRPPAKKRRTALDSALPARSSARIAAAPTKSYNDDDDDGKAASRTSKTSSRQTSDHTSRPRRSSPIPKATTPSPDPDVLYPPKSLTEIQENWSAWTPVAPLLTRDDTNTFHFPSAPDFNPNKSPEEMLREGVFGGGYFRPIRSRKLGMEIADDWRELPPSWITGLNVERSLVSAEYVPEVNKFGVACGQSIEQWEAAGWIAHEFDVRGWFQWYCRFFQGRRCDDDERQIGRWRKCVGPTGRWRRALLKKYLLAGVREVWDDGEEEGENRISPVVHQTCFHWAFELRQEHLDEAWAGGGRLV